MSRPHLAQGLVLGMGIFWMTSGCTTCTTHSSARAGELAMSVKLQGNHRLIIQLQNTSNIALTASKSSLPWEWRYSLWVKAYLNDAGGSSLDERLPIADPARDEKVAILPGMLMEGKVDLNERFPELQRALNKRDVIVFWSYEPEFDSAKNARLAGWLTIPSSQ